MTAERWRQIESLFTEISVCAQAERERLLQERTAGDDDLRREVESLLSCDRDGDETIQTVVGNAAAAVKAGSVEGERLGAYRLVRKIGQGGMGTVYLAVRADDQYQKQVAIKLVRRGMETTQSVERFRHERQILASLEHSYIARLLDGGSSKLAGFLDETPYLVLEYIEGESIYEYCDHHQLNTADRCRLFLKVCEAVSYAHQKLVVHRDLKPGNILVKSDGTPKLLDFGIAKLLDDGSSLDSNPITLMGAQLTPDYASPEQVRGEHISTATDVYSLGAILYELLSGVRPHRFNTQSIRELERVICEVDPPPMSEAAPSRRGALNGDLDAIAAMAMRKEPERRYPSVEKLITDLTRYLDGLPVAARQGTIGYFLFKYVRRNRTAIAVSVLFAGALIGGAAFSTMEAIRASREQAKAEASQRNAELQAQEAQRQKQIAEMQRLETEKQRASADRQRILADRRFEQVRQLAGKFLLDFHGAIEKLPGSTPARKMVVQTGLEYYDKLILEAANNKDLLEEIARGYDRLGDVQGNPYFANLGDVPGALASYKKALSIRQRVADASPEFLRDRILGHVKLSQILAFQGDLKGAERYLGETFAMGGKASAASSPLVRTSLIKAYSAYGDVKIREGVHGEAIEPYLKMLEIANQLMAEIGENAASKAELSMAHTKLGDVYGRVERPEEALKHLRIAIEMHKQLAAAAPNDSRQTRMLYMTQIMIGRVLKSRTGQQYGKPGEVNEHLESAARLAHKMSAEDPDNRTALTDIAVAESALGEWLLEEKNTNDAIAAFRRAVTAAERLNNNTTQTSGNEDVLIQSYHRLAVGLNNARQFDEALECLEKAGVYLARAEKSTPGSSRYINRGAELMRAKADIYSAQKKWDEAAVVYTRIIAIYEEQMNRDPKNAGHLIEQPGLFSKLAECYAGAARWDSAVRSMQTALDRFNKIESGRPLVKAEADERRAFTAKLSQWQRQSELAAAGKPVMK